MKLQTLAQKPLSAYQRYISKDYNGVRGSQCGFHPSCSAFARQEVKEEGVTGLREAFYRLRRCTSSTSSERLTSFLLHVAHCPEERLDEFFTVDDPAVEANWEHFRGEVAKGRALLNGPRPEQGAKRLSGAMSKFFQRVHMSLEGELKPGATPHFHLEAKRAPRPVERADRGRIGNFLRSAAGTLGGVVGAGLGALGAGVGATLVGASEGFTAGSGRLPLIRKRVEDRFGKGSLSGSEPFLQGLNRLSHKLDPLPGRVLETALGGALGTALGAVAGLVGGTLFGAKTGWEMGGLLGANWSDSKLAHRFPSEGALGPPPAVDKASTAPPPQVASVDNFRRLLNQVPPSLSSEGSGPALDQEWSMVGLLDGTDPALESHEVQKLKHFEKKSPEGLSSTLVLRRGSGKVGKALPWLLAAATPLAFAVNPALGLAGGVALWAATEKNLERAESRQQSLVQSSAPLWDGTGTFEEGRLTERESRSAPLGPVALEELFRHRFSTEEENRVLLLSGHGDGRRGIGGYRPAELADALQSSDRKVRLGIFEGCQTATLEGLAPLQGEMRYALASQLDMDGVGLPWHHLLKNLPAMGESPEQFASGVVELVGGIEPVPSLSLVDLEALETLKARVNDLSRSLLRNGETEQVAEAIDSSLVSEPEGLGTLLKPRRIDLKQFLESLGEGQLSESTREQLGKTQESLEQAVVATKSSQPLGGLSLELPSGLAFSAASIHEAFRLK